MSHEERTTAQLESTISELQIELQDQLCVLRALQVEADGKNPGDVAVGARHGAEKHRAHKVTEVLQFTEEEGRAALAKNAILSSELDEILKAIEHCEAAPVVVKKKLEIARIEQDLARCRSEIAELQRGGGGEGDQPRTADDDKEVVGRDATRSPAAETHAEAPSTAESVDYRAVYRATMETLCETQLRKAACEEYLEAAARGCVESLETLQGEVVAQEAEIQRLRAALSNDAHPFIS